VADYSQLNKTNKNIGEVLLEMISKSQSVLNHSQELRKNLKPKIMENTALPSSESLKDNIKRYRLKIAISSHIKCSSSRGVGVMDVFLIN
jgi:hypothetical protein